MAVVDSETFTDEVGMADFGSKMEKLRLARCMPDLVIQAKNNEKVYAHRIVLASRYPHLQEMLSGPPSQANTRLHWPRISANTIEVVVSFAYTGIVQLTSANVLRVFLIAYNLRSSTLKEFCVKFIKTRLTLEKIGEYWTVAIQTSSDELKSACLDFIRTDLVSFITTPLLPKLDITCLIKLLHSVSSNDEETKFLVISSWFEAGDNRNINLNELLSTISWSRLSPSFLLKQMGLNTKLANQPEARSLIVNRVEQPQRRAEIFVIGRNSTDARNYDIIQYNHQTGNESLIGHWPYRSFASLVALNDSLFLIGGGDPPSRTVNCFNLTSKTHKKLASMSIGRRACGVASSTEEIIVCGGWDGSTDFNLCEVYQTKFDGWLKMPDLISMRTGLGVVWLSDGRIFAIGGEARCSTLNSVEMITRSWNSSGPTDGAWRFVAPMLTSRSCFGVVLLHDVIIVAGGFNIQIRNMNSVEMFTLPEANAPMSMGQWTQIQLMISPMCIYTGITLDDEILMFDHKSGIQRFQTPQKNENMGTIRRFDSWNWTVVKPLTSIKSDIYSVVFK